jgi:hypothetical protein
MPLGEEAEILLHQRVEHARWFSATMWLPIRDSITALP